MAAIGSIRKRSGLLIIIIGVALVLFLLTDFLGRGPVGGPSGETNVGTILGESVSQQEFALRVENAIQEQSQNGAVSEVERTRIRSRVWEEILRERILDPEYEKLGIHVSPDELLSQIKNAQPGSLIYQYFSDRQTGQVLDQFRDPNTGLLDGNKVLQTIANILESENSSQWLPIEKAIKEDTKMQKYFTLLRSGLTATSVEAKQNYEARSSAFSFNYIVKEYSAIEDAAVEVTDADLKAYYNKHKSEKRFQQKSEQRDVKYVVFEMTASAEDIEDIKADMADMMPSFEADTNDTFFVLENSDRRLNENLEFKTAETMDVQIKDMVIASEIGKVFGPYQQGEYMMISKLSNIKATPDSAKARHIFIQANPQDTAAMADANNLLDSLKTVIEKRNNFSKMAEKYSGDLGTAANGGDLGDWLSRDRQDLPASVINQTLEGTKGDLKIITSEAGVHLVDITEQTNPVNRYLLATVDRKIEPSKETSDRAYSAASKFAIEHKTRASFEASNEEYVIQVAQNVVPGAKMIGRVSDAEEIVRWAFNAEAGDISEPKETQNSVVVAMVDIVKEKGVMSFEAIKEGVRPAVIKEKKAEKIIADLGSLTDLAAASNKVDAAIQTVSDVNFDANVMPGGLGRELKVLGVAAALEPNTMSQPIEGNRGVFVIQLTTKRTPSDEGDIASEKRQLSSELSNKVDQSAYDALKDASKIEDNRALFY
jgi:peptidyl-prolyl cis-trans isomerase D